ncbi:MAG: hypothetical protein SGJ27_12755 [Candidatus Melainabacteria bacterium]|nr:hypothetical protein [Candidatus Melainabacteria bacterium]
MQNPEVNKAVEFSRPPSHIVRNSLALLAVSSAIFGIGAAIIFKQLEATALLTRNRLPPAKVVVWSPAEDKTFGFYMGEERGVFLDGKTLKVNGLTDDQLTRCAKYPEPKTIDLLNCESLTGSGLKHLISRSPETLKFRSEIQDKYFKYMAQMPELENIDFRDLKQADGSGFLALTELKKLKYLTLDGCQVSDTMLKNISKIDSVKVIRLTNSKGFGAKGLSHLQTRPLTYLNLNGTDLDDDKLKELAGLSVSEFSITDNPEISNKSAEVIKTFKNIGSISFANSGIDTTQRMKLAAHFGLRYDLKKEMAIKKQQKQ